MKTALVYINKKDAPFVVGKGHRVLKDIELRTGATLWISNQQQTCLVTIRGPNEESINAARTLVAHHTTRSSMHPRLACAILDGDFSDEDVIHFESIETNESGNAHSIGSQAYMITRIEAISGRISDTRKEEEEQKKSEELREEEENGQASSVLAASRKQNTLFGARELTPLVVRGLKNEIRSVALSKDVQCIISIRFGRQHLLDLPPNAETSTTVGRWRVMSCGKGGIRLSFCNGLTGRELNALKEFLLKEGFDNVTKDRLKKRSVVLLLNVLKSFGRAHASLSWDELQEKWQLRKLAGYSNRVAIASFLQPSKSQLDFRIVVETRKRELLEQEEVNNYLQAQQNSRDKVTCEDIRFVSTEEVNLSCARYKVKEQFSNDEFKVAIEEVEQDDMGNTHTQTEVILKHFHWKALKHLTGGQESEPYLSELAHAAEMATSKVEETIEFARKITCVLGQL